MNSYLEAIFERVKNLTEICGPSDVDRNKDSCVHGRKIDLNTESLVKDGKTVGSYMVQFTRPSKNVVVGIFSATATYCKITVQLTFVISDFTVD